MLLWTVTKTYVARALHQAAVISPYPRHTASSQWKCNVRCELTIFIATTASIFCFAYYSANSAFKDRLEMQVGLTIICLRLKGGGSYSDCCSSKQMLLVAEINLLMESAHVSTIEKYMIQRHAPPKSLAVFRTINCSALSIFIFKYLARSRRQSRKHHFASQLFATRPSVVEVCGRSTATRWLRQGKLAEGPRTKTRSNGGRHPQYT